MQNRLLAAAVTILCLPVSSNGGEWAPVADSIPTGWGKALTVTSARPEYPRSQMVRDHWVNRNGLWSYAVTEKSAGRPAEWDKQMLVPFTLESPSLGLGRRLSKDEVLGYRRRFDRPRGQGRRLLHFDPVDCEGEVRINGASVGTHVGGNLPNERRGQHKTLEPGKWITGHDRTRLVNIASGGNSFATGDVSATPTETAKAKPARPNIVIILVDDMGYSDIGCYGGEIDTPNIDRLAASGLRFTQFYNSGRCCPTRASLMTGLHPHQVGIGHMTAPPNRPLGFEGPYQGYLNDRCTTLAQLLKSAGYHTLMTGKWHLGANRSECWPLQRGFDRFYGGLSGAFNYFRPGGDRGLTEGNKPVAPGDDFYATDAFTDVACRYISEATQSDDKPFFLYLAYNAPHWPLNSKWEEFQKYKGKYRDGWEELMKRRLARQKHLGLFPKDLQAAPHVGPEWSSLGDKQRENLDSIMAAYAGCIDSIDQNVGKLTNHLRELGELENTLIFFLSDNGACQEGGRLGQGSAAMVKNPPLETTAGVRLGLCWANACNTPFRKYKHFVHEGGACTPMIAFWPAGIPADRAGSFVRQAAYLPDFMPTLLEVSGAAYPSHLPATAGSSLLGSFRHDGAIHPEPIYWEHEGNAAVRWGRWKLVREYQQPWELYDIEKDRTELDDLAARLPEKREQLVTLWKTWATANQVAFPKRFNMYDFLRRQNESGSKRVKN